MSATLTFAGAAGTVTGSKYLVDTARARVLLECGLFQGLKALRLRNWADPPFDPRTLDAVVLSHGHLDHAGYLPLVVRHGFRGAVHCTAGTADLLGVLLRDAARLQEEDAARANRYGYSKHHPALPLYTADDVAVALDLVVAHPYDDLVGVADGVTARFRRAGHILGAASVELQLGDGERRTLVSSGDLGRWDRPILHDPVLVRTADVLLVESTYGDRTHRTDVDEQLARVVRETAERRGALIVPSFAIGRTQELLWWLRTLEDSGRIPRLPVYLDSPMAIEVTDIYCRHTDEHDLAMAALTDEGRSPLRSRDFHIVRTSDESRTLNDRAGPIVIIAGSGMATGGRVLHHLAHRLGDPRTTVLLTGYQAEGTRGRALQDGAESVKIHGRHVAVKAKVEVIDGLSAHADQGELLRWLRGFARAPGKTYVVHGEAAASRALADTIRRDLGWEVDVAKDAARIDL